MKAFYVKKAITSRNFTSFEITEDQTAWMLFVASGTPYIYRVSDNGTIIQIIWFGSINLSYSSTVSVFKMVSNTDFMFVEDFSLQNTNMSVGPTTGTDFSIARISTNLSVK